ncbi:MAG: ribonuclease [Sphingomicrobium sp.]
MAEWLTERGVGEERIARIDNGCIAEARIQLEGTERAGTVRLAALKSVGPPAIAIDQGQEYLLPKGARGATEGEIISIEVAREKIPGIEPWKRPLARYVPEGGLHTAPPLDAEVLPIPSPIDRLEQAGWSDVLEEARSGVIRFAGGELRISATPAMTLIDVDGYLDPEELAVRGADEAARAIRRLDIGGSVGIDLPSSGSKAARHAAAAAIDKQLPQPFERTAVNGFGFVQIVRPRNRASLIELAQDRAAFEARALLRRVAFEPPGPKRLVAHPAVIALLEGRHEWTQALCHQVGGAVSLRAEPALPMSAGYAESR